MASADPLAAFVNPSAARERNCERTSTNTIARFEYHHGPAGCLDGVCGGQAGKSRAHNTHVNRYLRAAQRGIPTGTVRCRNNTISVCRRVTRSAREAHCRNSAGDLQKTPPRDV